MQILRKLFALPTQAAVSNPLWLKSNMCHQAQQASDVFQGWVPRIREHPGHMHRKVWEFCYIAQALSERGLLSPGKRGLGFAVGQEPLTALFADSGCEILATDLGTAEASKGGWVETAQHADSLDVLNKRGICVPDVFQRQVRFRSVDMRDLPDDLGSFDFIWSSCSLEHLGSLALGEKFVFESLKYLVPGGWAVHTTEYNLSSDSATVSEGHTVLFRKRDIQRIAKRLRRLGHHIELDFTEGRLPADQVIDQPPYTHQVHLKLSMLGHIVTSFGLIIRKAGSDT